MIRWNYLLPRLVILILLILSIRIAANPVFKTILTASLETMFNAQVDIDESEINFFPPQINISRIEIADPRKDKRDSNLIEADAIKLHLDLDSLLHRELVIKEASIHGILLDSDRERSERLLKEDEKPKSQVDPSSVNLLTAFSDIGVQAKKLANKKIADLHITQEMLRIRQAWAEDFSNLQEQIRNVEQSAIALVNEKDPLGNPLRTVETIEKTLEDLQEKQRNLLSIHKQIKNIPLKIQQDQQALLQAKEDDQRDLHEQLALPSLRSETITMAMLEEASLQLVEEATEYLQYGQKIAAYTVVPPKTSRHRGTNFALAPNQGQSAIVNHCEISGHLRHRGVLHLLNGKIENFPRGQTAMTEPCRLKLSLQGKDLISLEHAFQAQENQRISQITVHWPKGMSEHNNFGNPKKTGISWTAANRELWIQIRKNESDGNDAIISGRIVNVQRDTKLIVNHSDEHAANALSKNFQNRIRSINNIQFDISFSKERDGWKLNPKTDLPQQLLEISNQCIEDGVATYQMQLNDRVEKIYDEQNRAFELWLITKRREISRNYESAIARMDEIQGALISGPEQARAYLSRLKTDVRSSVK